MRHLPLILLTLLCTEVVAMSSDAEIVSLSGRGETRESDASDWKAAFLQQALVAGNFIRTHEYSQAALLLRDQTQVRLNQNSLLQIKTLSERGAASELELLRGRSWMQRKGSAPAAQAGAPSLEIRTPYAMAAIRGTDWELQVDDDGSATLSVFSGSADFYNEFGRVSVGANEQARVQMGKAPVKTLLTQPLQRVQWLTAYRAQAQRWGSAGSPEATRLEEAMNSGRLNQLLPEMEANPLHSADNALLLADLLLAQGRIGEARQLLAEARGRYPERGKIIALLARATLIDAQPEAAAQLLETGRQRHADEIEIWLAAGDLARYQGDAAEARTAYRKALGLDEKSAEAWFGLALIESEREHVALARGHLAEALRLDENGAGYFGEAGTLETFADRYTAAENAFASTLQLRPDDYVALTGQGLLLLKRGRTREALQNFLKAGVIEARYARAALYTGVAYYQLGEYAAANEMFARAAEIDPRDPLPHVMRSMAHNDAVQLGEAVAAARAASERMPFLKSLNQLQNDQKGSANTGAALAAFGLEEWARQHAWQAWNPYWAGSHLFLADRLNGNFNKNSELFQGFLSDPTAFGASNRHTTLLQAPGDYATLTAGSIRQTGQAALYQATLNGYHNETIPLAYFFEGDSLKVRPAAVTENADLGVATVGLGARPQHDIGFFLFANRERLDSILSDPGSGFYGTPQTRQSRVDLGFNLRLSPFSQSWFKAGYGEIQRRVAGTATDLPGWRLYSWAFPEVRFSDSGDYLNRSSVKGYDWQWRHTVDMNAQWQLGFGIEHGRQDLPLFLRQELPTDAGLFYHGMREQTSHESTDIHLSNRLRPQANLLLQIDLSAQQLRKHFQREQFYGVVDLFETPQAQNSAQHIRQINPRLGLAWQASSTQTIRLAWQKWRRPAGQNTLGAIDTAGIALDDRLVATGGSLQRLRAQYEIEWGANTLVSLHGDQRKIDNLLNPGGTLVSGTSLDTLERLRRLFAQGHGETDPYEATPDFAAGKINSAGIAINQIVNDRLSFSSSYSAQKSRNTATGKFFGNQIPLLPRHSAQIGATWIALPRLKLEALGIYRSARFVDEANSAQLASGWNTALRASSETPDKRFAAGFRAENLLSRAAAGFERKPLLGLLLSWRI